MTSTDSAPRWRVRARVSRGPQPIPRRGSSFSPRRSQRRAARSHPQSPSHAYTSPPSPDRLRLNTSETSAVTPSRTLKGLAGEVTGPFVLSGRRCHGLRFLARISGKLGSRRCVLSSHPSQRENGDGQVADEGFNTPDRRDLQALYETLNPLRLRRDVDAALVTL